MTHDPAAEHHHWPSHRNPGFDSAKDDELARLYGGRTAPGYLHRVLGEHAMPAQSVFNLDDYQACVQEIQNFQNLDLTEDDLNKNRTSSSPSSLSSAFSSSSFLNSQFTIHNSARELHLGVDLGYSHDPSELVVFQNAEPHFINLARIRLTGVNYARQLDVIRELDRIFDFTGIAIDAGNNGRAIAHQLMSIDDHWCARVRCIDFGGAVDLDPLPDGTILRRNSKEFMTELLIRRMTERTIVFPPLDDRESQYANHTWSRGLNGRILYDKTNDHLIDADRCAILSHYLNNKEPHYVPLKPKLHLINHTE